jgi:nucleolar GTP-binding protein
MMLSYRGTLQTLCKTRLCPGSLSSNGRISYKSCMIRSNSSAQNHGTMGAFKSDLPDLYTGPTHMRRGLRSLKNLKPDVNIKNQRDRARKYAAMSLDTLMKGLTIPLTRTLKAYNDVFRNAHPFESSVGELVVRARVKEGHADLADLLVQLRGLRTETGRIAKSYASSAGKANSAVEANNILEEGISALRSLYIPESGLDELDGDSKCTPLVSVLDELLELQKALRRIPVLELNTRTVVLVGTPNVGKSSIVRAVSTGLPEVNDYPFTTRSVTIGHIVDKKQGLRLQVMDTPGLLNRTEEHRNEMEKLTFASLKDLPTAVIFVIDPSGLSGEQHSSLEAQLAVRDDLRARFPKRPWLDVVSKADLNISHDILTRMPQGNLHVSVLNGHNMDVLHQEIHSLTSHLAELLAQRVHNV